MDDKKWLGIPSYIWDKLFLAFAVAVLGWLTHTNTSAIVENGEQQVKHAKELKTEVADGLSNVAAKVDLNTAETAQVKVAAEKNVEATQAIPVAAVEAAKVVVEQKAADAKPDPPGL
jgi:hypothetical protein